MASSQGIAWIVVVTCLLLGIETTFAIKGALQTNRLRREVSASEQRLQALRNSDPPLTPCSLAQLRRDYSEVKDRWLVLNDRIFGGGRAIREPSDVINAPQDLYFELVAFSEEKKKEASARGIQLMQGGAGGFGFSDYIASGNGPPQNRLLEVFNDRVILGELVDLLFDAGLMEILSVDRLQSSDRHPAKTIRASEETTAPYFEVAGPSGGTANIDTVTTRRYQLAFSGRTSTLRAFLNSIARAGPFLSVSEVEVKPSEYGGAKAGFGFHPDRAKQPSVQALFGDPVEGEFDSVTNPPSIPIVGDNIASFLVRVDWFDKSSHRPVSTAASERIKRQSGHHHQWKEPVSQTSGKDWLFEVFTPPIIYFNQQTGAFVLEPPLSEKQKDDSPDVVLLRIERPPYRIQVEGFVGNDGDYTALLKRTDVQKGFLARPGQRYRDLGIRIDSIQVGRRSYESGRGDATTVESETVEVLLFDEYLRTPIRLTNIEQVRGPEAVAAIQYEARPLEEVIVREGDSIVVGGEEYLLGRIDEARRQIHLLRVNSSGSEGDLVLTLGRDRPTGIEQASRP